MRLLEAAIRLGVAAERVAVELRAAAPQRRALPRVLGEHELAADRLRRRGDVAGLEVELLEQLERAPDRSAASARRRARRRRSRRWQVVALGERRGSRELERGAGARRCADLARDDRVVAAERLGALGGERAALRRRSRRERATCSYSSRAGSSSSAAASASASGIHTGA